MGEEAFHRRQLGPRKRDRGAKSAADDPSDRYSHGGENFREIFRRRTLGAKPRISGLVDRSEGDACCPPAPSFVMRLHWLATDPPDVDFAAHTNFNEAFSRRGRS